MGSGDAVVSGRVQPDTLRVDRETGRVLAVALGTALPRSFASGPPGDGPRRRPCLDGGNDSVFGSWENRSRTLFGSPQDIEWAIHAGKLYVLQVRPITTLEGVELAPTRLQAARDRLERQAAAGRGPWVLHNLAETLLHPTRARRGA